MKTTFSFILLLGFVVGVSAQATSFTYQGHLLDNGSAATGIYDLRFTIYDALTGGSAVGGPVTNAPTAVSNGLFTAALDFGSAPFDGPARWLQIGVRTNGSLGDFTPLEPRQAITSTPYAIRAANFSGAVADTQLSANVARLDANQTFSGSVEFTNSANSFAGNGMGVTNVQLETIDTERAIVPMGLAGSFSLVGNLTVGPRPIVVRAADVNGDDWPDFISANQGNHTISVLTNDRAGNFTLASTLALTDLSLRALAVGDVNGDGAPDVVAAQVGVSPVRLAVFTNDGGGGFISVPQPAVPGTVTAREIAMGLINADDSPDVLLGLQGMLTAFILTNNGAGVFTYRSASPVDAATRFFELADFTGDGRADVAGSSRAWTNNGSGTFTQSSGLFSGLAGMSRPHVADVNNDGRPDVTATAEFGDGLAVFTNGGGGQFTLMTTNSVPGVPIDHTTVDVNGDGYFDVITANNEGNSISVLINNGNGTFSLRSSTAVGIGPSCLAAGDWNDDGRIDLVVANETNGTLSVLLGDNRYTFTGTFNGLGTGLSGLNASSLTLGTVPGDRLAGTYGKAVSFTNAGNSFSGNGSGLVNLNASALTTGTVPGPRLAGTYSGAVFFNNLGNGFVGDGSGLRRISSLDAVDGSPNEALNVDPNGVVGIGTSTPVNGIANSRLTVIGGHVVVGNNFGFLSIASDGTGIGAGLDTTPTEGLEFYAAGTNRMVVQTNGNVGIGTNNPAERLHVVGNILATGTITPNSDRNAKTNLAPVDTTDVLKRVVALPVLQWRFKGEAEQVKHVGPMAQDFHAAFGLGGIATAIATVDADGVALAAIQGLNQKLEERLKSKEAEIQQLRQRLTALEQLINSR